jgi:MoaA/NifB/PqqE/SkfB family radical SAM enzyme
MYSGQRIRRTRIDVERLMEIIEEMHGLGLRAVTLVGSGEPTLHPRIDEIISGIARRGVDVGLFTNGSCITEATLRAILDYTTFVRFSFTGATPAVHTLVHGSKDFHRVIDNVRRVVRGRRGRRPTLGSQFVLASYSAPDLIKAVALAKAMRLDYFEIKPAYAAPDKAKQLPNTLSVDEAQALVEEAESCSDEAFKVYGKSDQVRSVFVNSEERPYDDCPGHKTTAVIEAGLNVYICVNQKIPQFCFGALTTHSFREVWHSRRRQEILKALDVHKCMTCCRQDPLNRLVQEIRTGSRTIPTDLAEADPEMHVNFL